MLMYKSSFTKDGRNTDIVSHVSHIESSHVNIMKRIHKYTWHFRIYLTVFKMQNILLKINSFISLRLNRF